MLNFDISIMLNFDISIMSKFEIPIMSLIKSDFDVSKCRTLIYRSNFR